MTAENQADVTLALDKIGAIVNLGWSQEVKAEDIALKLKEIVKKPTKVKKLIHNSLSVMGDSLKERLVSKYMMEEECND